MKMRPMMPRLRLDEYTIAISNDHETPAPLKSLLLLPCLTGQRNAAHLRRHLPDLENQLGRRVVAVRCSRD
jgi:hypothetical protein